MHPYSIYIHIPFCRHRCAYCDFNTYAGKEDLIPTYVHAVCREIEWVGHEAPSKINAHTIFLGGGTPSLLSVDEVERILVAVEEHFDLLPGLEVTLEANPGTVTLAYMRDLKKLGINRLSLGMQSVIQRELNMLERQHDFGDVIHAVHWARIAGISNVNIDLIYGLPDQGLEDWKRNLAAAVSLETEHLSLYSLTLENGTPMEHWVKRGLINEPESDLAADMYEYSMDYLEGVGYKQYEISNWARIDKDGTLISCEHNVQYWRNLPYLGFGAGGHGFVDDFRIANVLSPTKYIQRCLDLTSETRRSFPRSPANISFMQLSQAEIMSDTIIMALRLTREGLSQRLFRERFGVNFANLFAREIDELIALNLLEWAGSDGDILRLTPSGRLLGNQAFIRFV